MRVSPAATPGTRTRPAAGGDAGPDPAQPYELPPDGGRRDEGGRHRNRRGDVPSTTPTSSTVPSQQLQRRRAALTIRYVPASTRIKDQPDRRQFWSAGERTRMGTCTPIDQER